MITLSFTPGQKQLLLKVLELYLSELRTEISHTDNRDFRTKLKEEKEELLQIIALLEEKQTEDG